jgi:hypothetical protein
VEVDFLAHVGPHADAFSSWCFELTFPRIPIGLFSLALIYISIPNEFPDLGTKKAPAVTTLGLQGFFARAWRNPAIATFDFIGAGLLLASTGLLLYSVQTGGSPDAPWSHPSIIVPLVIAILGFVLFGWYETRLMSLYEKDPLGKQPLLPKSLFQSRQAIFIVIFAFFAGAPFYTMLLVLPQRFEIVSKVSPTEAGVRLLPLMLLLPIMLFALSILARKFQIPTLFAIVGAAVLVSISLGILSTAPKEWRAVEYFLEALAGIGTGPTLSLALSLMIDVMEKRDPEALCKFLLPSPKFTMLCRPANPKTSCLPKLILAVSYPWRHCCFCHMQQHSQCQGDVISQQLRGLHGAEPVLPTVCTFRDGRAR